MTVLEHDDSAVDTPVDDVSLIGAYAAAQTVLGGRLEPPRVRCSARSLVERPGEGDCLSWVGRGSIPMSFVVERSMRCWSGTARSPTWPRDLGIGSPETLRNWVRKAERDRGLTSGPTTEELAEIRQLRREVADQQRTIGTLKPVSALGDLVLREAQDRDALDDQSLTGGGSAEEQR